MRVDNLVSRERNTEQGEKHGRLQQTPLAAAGRIIDVNRRYGSTPREHSPTGPFETGGAGVPGGAGVILECATEGIRVAGA